MRRARQGRPWGGGPNPHPAGCAPRAALAAAAPADDRNAAVRNAPASGKAAADRLRRAAELAAQLSASRLLQRITRLTRQARIDLLAGTPEARPARFWLTDREFDAL